MLIRLQRLAVPAFLFTILTLSGCASLTPQPLTRDEITTTSANDQQQARKDVEPLQGPLTLEEAIARAIKYNLDRRTRLMQETLAQGQFDVGKYDMLPKLMASAGYRERNNDLTTI
jgi:outer membrane protein TolC